MSLEAGCLLSGPLRQGSGGPRRLSPLRGSSVGFQPVGAGAGREGLLEGGSCLPGPAETDASLRPSALPGRQPRRAQGIGGPRLDRGEGREGPGGTWGSVCPPSPSASGPSLTVSSLSAAPGPLFLSAALSSFAVSTSCLLALLRPQHPGGSEAMCPWYVSGCGPSLPPLAPAALFLLLSTSPPSPFCPACFSGAPRVPTSASASELGPPSPAGPARASGPRSSASRPWPLHCQALGPLCCWVRAWVGLGRWDGEAAVFWGDLGGGSAAPSSSFSPWLPQLPPA